MMSSNENEETEKDEAYNMTVTDRRSTVDNVVRSIKKPMINRSCINTLNFCYKQLPRIPL